MGSPFETADDRKLSEEELERALTGGTAATWAKFPKQLRPVRAGLSVATVGAVAPSAAMIATATRVRRANPQIFGEDGNRNTGADPTEGPAPASGNITARGVLGAISTAVAFFSNPLMTVTTLMAKIGYTVATTGKAPDKAPIAGPMAAFEAVEKLADKLGGSEKSATPTATAPAPVDWSVTETTMDAVPVTTTRESRAPLSELADVPAAVDTGAGQGAATGGGAGGFGGGYGGDAPSGDGSDGGRE